MEICNSEYTQKLQKTVYLTEQSKTLYSEYQQAYENDPFAESTIEIGETLLNHISIEKRDRWQELITGIDMTHNSKKLGKPSRNSTQSQTPTLAYQKLHQTKLHTNSCSMVSLATRKGDIKRN